MTDRVAFRVLAVSTAVLAGSALTSMSAYACDDVRCPEVVEALPQSSPLRLDKFRRKPVATAAARTVKTRDGRYAQVTAGRVAAGRRAKQRLARPEPPQFVPVQVSPEAAQAYALWRAVAQVRVVPADELNEIDLAADDTPIVPIAITTTVESAVQGAGARGPDAIDSRTAATQAISLDTLARDLAGDRKGGDDSRNDAKGESWLQRMLVVIERAFTAVAAAARGLTG
jgi:hypothetical protein